MVAKDVVIMLLSKRTIRRGCEGDESSTTSWTVRRMRGRCEKEKGQKRGGKRGGQEGEILR